MKIISGCRPLEIAYFLDSIENAASNQINDIGVSNI